MLKLFTLIMEDMFKELKWDDRGIKIDGESLNHLRFADDIVGIATDKEELQQMLQELHNNQNKLA